MERDSQSVVTRQLLCLAPYYLINLSVGLVQGLTGLAQITPVLFMGKLLGGLCCGLQASPCSSYYTEVSSPAVMCLHVTCRL